MASWVDYVRVIHILGAVVWAGGGLFSLLFLGPAVKSAGPVGQQFMGAMMKGGGPARIMGPVSIVTILAGLVLYSEYGYAEDPFGNGARIAVTIGAALGIIVLVLGLGVGMPLQRKMKKMAASFGPGGPTPEQKTTMERMGKSMATFGTSVTWLLVAVLVLMVARSLAV